MDLFRKITSIYSGSKEVPELEPEILPYYYWFTITYEILQENLHGTIIISIIIIILLFSLYLWRKWQIKGDHNESLLSAYLNMDTNRTRFRKRDKMLFYGRRMLRKVKTLSGQAYGGQGRKRRAVMRFAKRLLQLKREKIPMLLKTVEPPAEYLEETADAGDKVPPDALYMLQGIRIFGHFEKPIFLKLCKHTEIISLQTNDLLFKIGDPDDSVFIVQSGLLNVLINNVDGTTLSLKVVKKGESVTSLLSFIDVLAGNLSIYKSVTAKAVEPSQVIRLPMQAFKEVFDENPEILISVIQVIMTRLQRVTFTALRNYLGLNSELIQPRRKTTIGNAENVYGQTTSGCGSGSASGGGVSGTTNKNSPKHQKRPAKSDFVHTLSCDKSSEDVLLPGMLADITEHQMGMAINNNKKHSTGGNLMIENEAPTLLSLAVDGFVKELGLSDCERHLLDGVIEIKEVQPGITLMVEGNHDDVSLLYIITGSLSILQHSVTFPGIKKKTESEVHSHSSYSGEMIGGLAVLTGEASLHTVRARVFSRIGIITRTSVHGIMREKPAIALDIANTVLRKLSPLVRQCDYALDWIFLESGRAVYRQDELSDSTYIVLSGRLRSVVTQQNGKKEIVGEYGKGDMVGIVEMITETPRTTTTMAVRDSELAKLPEGLFNAITIKYPVVVTRLISLLSHRILGSMQSKPGTAPYEANPVTHKFSTVALVPVSDDVPLTAFTYELYHSLCAIGPTLRLTSDVVRKILGNNILESNYEYRLTSWLAQQEDRNNIALYQCDNTLSAWTQRCMRQADVIIIVGLGDRAPTVGTFEKEIDKLAMRTQKELVLLHHEVNVTRPTNTLQWLNLRPWVTNHHHIQCPKRMFTRKSQYRLNDMYSKVLAVEPNMHSDFSRLARWLTGNSVGLVLGGGGARGAAHVGMIKSIMEAGIPIDMVGGVSIGAFMGALWCAERNIVTVTQKAREWSKKMTQWHRQLLDLTYPITSMFSGRGFNQTIRDTFGDIYIEDLWTPYFTLTTDITASSARVHTNGSLWRFVRASMSLSGYMPPLCDPKDGHLLLDGGYVNNLPGCLWRYVRASMSIPGVLPPLCDYKDGHLLVDGCFVNNVPADVMHNLGAAHIIAIDVGSQDDTDLTDYGDDLSGWWLLYKKWNPFTTQVKVPNLPDIQSRLAYVSCVRQLEEVKISEYCEYIRPPIDKYKTLAFGSFDEIKDVGYAHGRTSFELMSKSGRIGRFNQWINKEVPKKHSYTMNEHTFIDLAQIVCKQPKMRFDKIYSSSDDDEDYYDGYISEPTTMNREKSISIKRTGGSLSLSENEIDSEEDDDDDDDDDDDEEDEMRINKRQPLKTLTPTISTVALSVSKTTTINISSVPIVSTDIESNNSNTINLQTQIDNDNNNTKIDSNDS